MLVTVNGSTFGRRWSPRLRLPVIVVIVILLYIVMNNEDIGLVGPQVVVNWLLARHLDTHWLFTP